VYTHVHTKTKVRRYTYTYKLICTTHIFICIYVCMYHVYYTPRALPSIILNRAYHMCTHTLMYLLLYPVTLPGTKFYYSNYFCLAANVLHPPHHQNPTTCTLLSASFNLPFHSFLHLFLRTHRCIFLPTMQTSLLIQYHYCHPILPLNVRS
jgi:hypothetical protein